MVGAHPDGGEFSTGLDRMDVASRPGSRAPCAVSGQALDLVRQLPAVVAVDLHHVAVARSAVWHRFLWAVATPVAPLVANAESAGRGAACTTSGATAAAFPVQCTQHRFGPDAYGRDASRPFGRGAWRSAAHQSSL